MTDLTYKFSEAWLEPDGDGMMFCRETRGLASTVLEIDLQTGTVDGWDVTAIRMVEPIPVGPKRMFTLTGRLRESAMDFIIDNLVTEIDRFVAEETETYDFDQKCDERREVAA